LVSPKLIFAHFYIEPSKRIVYVAGR